jgi:excinuclease ABC subunit A
LDVIAAADWIIDLGPEGGSNGGQIIATGTPQQIIDNEKSHTAKFLRQKLFLDLNLSEKNIIKVKSNVSSLSSSAAAAAAAAVVDKKLMV